MTPRDPRSYLHDMPGATAFRPCFYEIDGTV